MQNVITVSGLSKAYKTAGNPALHWALKDVSFTLNSGDTLAIIGKNGSGKSTLLKILAQVYKPTTGGAVINGKVASILEVGTGFHPELTGYENIFFHGEVMGFKKSEIKARLDEIISFSGIEPYINEPVKTYSNGMFVRLASSIVVALNYDVLILDEVMGMGDAQFKMKFAEKLNQLTRRGTTIVMGSHNVNELFGCGLFIWLDNGQVKRMGSNEQILIEYLEARNTTTAAGLNAQYSHTAIAGDLAIEMNGLRLTRISFCNQQGLPQNAFNFSDTIYLHVEVVVTEPDCPFALMFALVDEFNTIVFGTSPAVYNPQFRTPAAGTVLRFRASLPDKILNFGNYYLDVYGYDKERRVRNLHRHLLAFNLIKEEVPNFNLRGNRMPGIIQPPIHWQQITD